MDKQEYTRHCSYCGDPVQLISVGENGSIEIWSRDHVVVSGETLCLDCLPMAGYRLDHVLADILYTQPLSLN